ncbi:Neuferricin-like protein [Aphelenchoides fujianensis]|nr:Neuferricin-like protein [Aphelenchoides fujianensis]
MPKSSPGLHTGSLIIISLNVIVISFLFTVYDVEIPDQFVFRVGSPKGVPRIRAAIDGVRSLIGLGRLTLTKAVPQTTEKHKSKPEPKLDATGSKVFTADQLALFDGSRPSKPVYLAILGRVYNVEKGRKHYSTGGGYHFFAGRDATRAFVTGDFTPKGLVDEIDDFSEQEMLSISDWVGFYDKEYELVGVVEGRFYDADGQPTKYGETIREKLAAALEYRKQQVRENEVFPACNSEWHKDKGGRVCGGVKREWAGVPRRLFAPGAKNYRCACVKNFGHPLATPGAEGTHGDLDNPNLKEYPNCSPIANSCKISKDDDDDD